MSPLAARNVGTPSRRPRSCLCQVSALTQRLNCNTSDARQSHTFSFPPTTPPHLSLQLGPTHRKQAYDSDEEYGAVGNYHSTPHVYGGGNSPVISSSDEEESETEELEESLENCSINDSPDAVT